MDKIMTLYANLHTHSTHSDGVYTPAEIAKIAYDEGYRAFALTDHDTFTGNYEIKKECDKYGMECIYGTEFSSAEGYHLTAFHFDPTEPKIKEYLDQLSLKETDQTRQLFERGVKLGYLHDITWDDVLEYNKGITWLCNDHVFRTLKSKGMITDLEYPEFFETLFGVHRDEVPEIYSFRPAKEIIDMVHNAGGIIFQAHPGKQLPRTPELIKLGIDGVEVWHKLNDAPTRRAALKLARENDLYVSGGSDHSGLCGGQYERYEHPEETEFWLPPITLGTTQYFYEEIRDMKKRADRFDVMDALTQDDSLWVRIK